MKALGLETPSIEEDPWVSPDRRTIYFTSTRQGGVPPLVWATR